MKPARNDPCSCGSGKKYKHCCEGKVASRIPEPSPSEINQLIALYNVGRYAELESRARFLVGQYPDFGFGWKLLGGALQMQGKNALPAFQRAAELMPGEADAHYNLGAALKSFGLLDDAVASYRRALQLKPDYAEAYSNLGNVLKELGQLADAVACYRRALQLKTNSAEAYNSLGNALKDIGQTEEAVASYQRALALKPDYAEAYNNLGNVLKERGQLNEAVASYRRAIESRPDLALTHNNLGAILQALGQLDEAAASYRRALAIKPDFTEAYYNLGTALHNLGQLDGAVANYRRALEIKPDYAEAHNSLGNVMLDLGQFSDAIACYRRALAIKPNYAAAHNNLGNPLKNLGQLDDAVASYRRAVEIKPDFAEAYCNLGVALRRRGDLSDAKACYRKAQELGYNGARVCDALMLPDIMGTRQELMESRAEFERNLDKLIADRVTLDDPLMDVDETNFYLAYHGLNDRDLQVKVAKFYEQACPSLLYTASHCTKPKSNTQKIRVGFLSKYLYSHSVSLCFSKIIETLSIQAQFEVALISNHPVDTKVYSEFVGKRVLLPYNLAQSREVLAALELDILVYLDIGMEPLSYFLAFSRLARTQCVLAGHPVTTGITNMDYFLSCGLMEPLDADAHYSEKLIRLPRPPIYFARPALPDTLKTRSELGLPDERHIYMCPMRLQKLHPDFDAAITRILQIDDNGVVVLFEDYMWPFWKKSLMKRFESTIPAEVRERIIFLPWLKDPADFISAIATADVVLDPFHFGIGSTAAVTCVTGTPLVTKTGEFMRGRVGAFYCEMLDLKECIAEDTEGYARKAVEIAGNRLLREEIREKILKNNSVLYDNLQPVDDLADFFYSLTGELAKQP